MSTLSIIQITLEIWGAIFCLICGFIVYIGRKSETKRSIILMYALFVESIQLISDSLAWIYRGSATEIGYYMVRISNFTVFLTNYILCLTVALYIFTIIKNGNNTVNRKWTYAILIPAVLGITLLIISQFTGLYYYFDENNFYHRQSYYNINFILSISLMAISVSMLVKHKRCIIRADFIPLLIYFCFPIVVGIIQIFFYGISLTNIANTITILLVFIVYERDKSNRILQQKLELAQQKNELTDTRISLMMSQIQPHFISNTLLTIQGMYHDNTTKADKIMNCFIRYLQQSFSDMSKNVPVTAQKEIIHTKNYTDIAKARWNDIEVNYHITTTDFLIPPLSVQPLVENAVRHGIMPLENGGKVDIYTYEKNDSYIIKVCDNGVGFDVNNPTPQYDDKRNHIGISNIKDRIETMCNGKLTIESQINKGTTVRITIPKE